MMEKELERAMQERLNNLVCYGTTHPEILKDVLYEMTNPPLLIHDKEVWP